MNQSFNRTDFDNLYTLFDPEARYAGYKPAVKERPNGDTSVDQDKRFLHVALKYKPDEWALRLLARAHFMACEHAESIGCPPECYPKVENGTLRVLEYPIGAGSAAHCDFDLFTVNLWRSSPADCEAFAQHEGDACEWRPNTFDVHTGELARLFGLGPAMPHRVLARDYAQLALVYFASPGMATPLPVPYTFPAVEGFDEVTVETSGAWQIERTKRSRVY